MCPLVALLLLIPLASPARADEVSFQVADLAVTAWQPSAGTPPPYPILLFSHGFHGCATGSRFLTEAFAADGYLVFAPNHRDATCHGGGASWLHGPELPFISPRTWTSATFRDRADDLRRLLAALRDDPRWRDQIDSSRLGLVGHSLGGYTVLGLAGAWPEWRLPGVRAVLALSPYVQPFLVHRTLRGLATPVMFQGGTGDFGITPWLEGPNGGYAAAPAPKFLIVFKNATHFVWTNLGLRARRQIVQNGLVFLDRYVRDMSAEPLLTDEQPGVAVLLADPG